MKDIYLVGAIILIGLSVNKPIIYWGMACLMLIYRYILAVKEAKLNNAINEAIEQAIKNEEKNNDK